MSNQESFEPDYKKNGEAAIPKEIGNDKKDKGNLGLKVLNGFLCVSLATVIGVMSGINTIVRRYDESKLAYSSKNIQKELIGTTKLFPKGSHKVVEFTNLGLVAQNANFYDIPYHKGYESYIQFLRDNDNNLLMITTYTNMVEVEVEYGENSGLYDSFGVPTVVILDDGIIMPFISKVRK